MHIYGDKITHGKRRQHESKQKLAKRATHQTVQGRSKTTHIAMQSASVQSHMGHGWEEFGEGKINKTNLKNIDKILYVSENVCMKNIFPSNELIKQD